LDSPEMRQILDPISQSLSQLSASVRRISHSLNNHLLLQQDLIKAIAAETERLNQMGRITIEFDIDEQQPKTFNANEKKVLYRIFHESIINSIKHADTDMRTDLSQTAPQI